MQTPSVTIDYFNLGLWAFLSNSNQVKILLSRVFKPKSAKSYTWIMVLRNLYNFIEEIPLKDGSNLLK